MVQSGIDLASEALSDYWSTGDASNLPTKLANTMSHSNYCPHFSFNFRCSVAFSLPVSVFSLALGGFTTWWLLLSNKVEVLKDLGSKASICALTSSNLLDDTLVKCSELLNRACKRAALRSVDASLSASRMRTISSQSSFEDAGCLENTSKGDCARQSSQSETTEPVTGSEASSPRDQLTGTLVGNPRASCLSDSEQQHQLHHQLIEAVMLGDEAFVASALQRIDPESLEELGTDEFGNSLLILAVQVPIPPTSFSRKTGMIPSHPHHWQKCSTPPTPPHPTSTTSTGR
jgi:hypothetical protein